MSIPLALQIAGTQRSLTDGTATLYDREDSAWVTNAAGNIVAVSADAVPVGTNVDGTMPIAAAFHQALTNRAANSDMSGYTVGAIDSGGAVPTGVSVGRGTGNWCNLEIVEIGAAFGVSYVRFRFHGTNPEPSTQFVQLRWGDLVSVGGSNVPVSATARVRVVDVTTAAADGLRVLVQERTTGDVYVNQASAEVPQVVGEWVWYGATYTVTAGNAGRLGVQALVDAGTSIDITFDVALPHLVYGIDLSADPNHPVILTTSNTPVTVANHDWLIDHAASGLSVSGPWWAVAVHRSNRQPATDYPRVYSIDDGTSNDFVTLRETQDASQRTQLVVRQSGVTEATTNVVTPLGQFAVHAVYVAANNVRATINGGAVNVDTSATMPVTSRLRIGEDQGGVTPLNGHIAYLAIGNGLPPGSGAGSDAEIDAALLKLSRDAYRAVFRGSTAFQPVPADLVGYV